ncbi:MAG: hypothetical protein U0T36_09055 [Saprospiraceae bacterium]
MCFHFEGFECITRMRDDANLRYIFNGKQKEGKGRPKKYGDKVNLNKIDKRRFKLVQTIDDVKIYECTLYCVMLKSNVKVAYVEFFNKKEMCKCTKYS